MYDGGFMEKGTIKKRIFLSNAQMVVVTLIIFLLLRTTEKIPAFYRWYGEQATDWISKRREKNDVDTLCGGVFLLCGNYSNPCKMWD